MSKQGAAWFRDRKGSMKYPDLTKANLRIRELEAEVERLRAELETWYVRATTWRDEKNAEVERLQRLVETVDRQRIANGDEVERLRTGSEAAGKALYRAEAENERLRADNDRGLVVNLELRERLDTLRAENAKLAQGILPAGAVVTFEEKE